MCHWLCQCRRHDGEEAPNGHRALKQRTQVLVASPRLGRLLTRQPRSQRRQDRLQALRLDQAIKVRQCAAADLLHREMPLRLERCAEVLDGSQRPNGGIEKRQQVSNEHVIQKQPSVAVRSRRYAIAAAAARANAHTCRRPPSPAKPPAHVPCHSGHASDNAQIPCQSASPAQEISRTVLGGVSGTRRLGGWRSDKVDGR